MHKNNVINIFVSALNALSTYALEHRTPRCGLENPVALRDGDLSVALGTQPRCTVLYHI